MTVYNKPLTYIGFMIAVTGGIVGYYSESQLIIIPFQIIGVIVMLFSLKKPR
jgi:hypothetical protein